MDAVQADGLADGSAVQADGSAVQADGFAVQAAGSAVQADGSAVQADGFAVPDGSAGELSASPSASLRCCGGLVLRSGPLVFFLPKIPAPPRWCTRQLV